MKIAATASCLALVLALSLPARAAELQVLNIWPGKPPGETRELPPEQNIAKPDEKGVAGRPIIKLANVSIPQIAIHRPDPQKDTKASVVICPGGGHHILAYDLEGTEVADWLNGIGVTGIVLKYRVPSRTPGEKKWLAAVQDAQRAVSLVRSKAGELGLDPQRIGILGFSAGGETAGLTALLLDQRQYAPVDDVDKVSSRPDFAVLVYPAWLFNEKTGTLQSYFQVTKDTPPMFFAHAFDDPITVLSTLALATELKRAGGSAEAHVYATGGHGYGLRPLDEKPCTGWPQACEKWLGVKGFLKK